MAAEQKHRLGSMRVDAQTKAALDRLSAETGKSMNTLVREAIAAYLKRRARA